MSKQSTTTIGRPTRLTSQVQDRLVNALHRGNYFSVACEVAGIGRRTGYRWLKQGEDDLSAGLETPHARFTVAVREAEAVSEDALVDVVGKAAAAGPQYWAAAMTILERRHPSRWRRRADDGVGAKPQITIAIGLPGVAAVEPAVKGQVVDVRPAELVERTS